MEDFRLLRLRKRMDGLDKKLVRILERRINLTEKIREFKNKNKFPERDPRREKEIISRISNKKIKKIYQTILK